MVELEEQKKYKPKFPSISEQTSPVIQKEYAHAVKRIQALTRLHNLFVLKGMHRKESEQQKYYKFALQLQRMISSINIEFNALAQKEVKK